MYTYDRVDRCSYTIKKNDIPFMEVEAWEDEVKQTVDALNFYEQAQTEHTCLVCGHSSHETIARDFSSPNDYVCKDADACVRRINQYHTCHRCGHTGPEVCLPMPGVSTEQWFCLGGCLPGDNRLGRDIDPSNYG